MIIDNWLIIRCPRVPRSWPLGAGSADLESGHRLDLGPGQHLEQIGDVVLIVWGDLWVPFRMGAGARGLDGRVDPVPQAGRDADHLVNLRGSDLVIQFLACHILDGWER